MSAAPSFASRLAFKMGYGDSYGKGKDYSHGGKSKDSYGGKGKDSSGSWKGKAPAALPSDPNEQWEMMQWMQSTLDQMKQAKGCGKTDSPNAKGGGKVVAPPYAKGGSKGAPPYAKGGGGGFVGNPGGFKKSKLCTKHEAGYCANGEQCTFAHGEHEIGQPQPTGEVWQFNAKVAPPGFIGKSGKDSKSAKGTGKIQTDNKGHVVQVWSAQGVGAPVAAPSKGSFGGSTQSFFGKGKRKGTDGKPTHKFMPWKLRLSNAYQGRHRKCPTKDTIQYETVEDEGRFTCTVRCEDFTLSHEAAGSFSSRKEAEEAAAKAACEHEYPEWLEKVAADSAGKPVPASVKRKMQYWKTRLTQAFTKEHDEPPHDSIEYTVEEREGGFIASVTCDRFVNSYVIDEIQPSQTLAEEQAAKMALEGEFPSFALADALEEEVAGASQAGQGVVVPPPKRAKTEKVAETLSRDNWSSKHPNFPLDSKCRLNEGLMIVLGRSLLKGDVEYTTDEQGGSMIASVTLSCLDPIQTFSGEGVPSSDPDCKRKSHKNAAEAALEILGEMIEAKRPEHEAMKAAKKAAAFDKKGQKRSADDEQLG